MSLTLVFADPERFALIASDRRAFGAADFAAGRLHGEHSDRAKIFPLHRGWVAGTTSARFWPLLLPVFQRHRADDLAGIRAALAEVRPYLEIGLAKHQGAELDYLRRADFYTIYQARGAFRSHAWYPVTGEDSDTTGAATLCWPMGPDKAEAGPRLDAFLADLLPDCTLDRAVALTRELHAELRARCGDDGALSRELDFGLLDRGPDGSLRQYNDVNLKGVPCGDI